MEDAHAWHRVIRDRISIIVVVAAVVTHGRRHLDLLLELAPRLVHALLQVALAQSLAGVDHAVHLGPHVQILPQQGQRDEHGLETSRGGVVWRRHVEASRGGV
eukprot:915604-Prymnesium_polylepis.1